MRNADYGGREMELKCKECAGAGNVDFTKGRGGPSCNGCGGAGRLKRLFFVRYIGAMLDHPSVFMGGPSKTSLDRAEKIADWLARFGLDDLDDGISG